LRCEYLNQRTEQIVHQTLPTTTIYVLFTYSHSLCNRYLNHLGTSPEIRNLGTQLQKSCLILLRIISTHYILNLLSLINAVRAIMYHTTQL